MVGVPRAKMRARMSEGHAMQTPALLGFTAAIAVLTWRIYVRIKRSYGPQRLSRFRAPVTFTIYCVLLLALTPVLWSRPSAALVMALCMGAGAGLGAVALTKSTFVARPGSLIYTPYAPIALTLAALFLVRILWRIAEILINAKSASQGNADFIRSGWTLGAFGLWVGYILWYTYGLAAWRRRVLERKRARETAGGA